MSGLVEEFGEEQEQEQEELETVFDKALCLSGRLRVIVATRSLISCSNTI